jgi:hypothetical protein
MNSSTNFNSKLEYSAASTKKLRRVMIIGCVIAGYGLQFFSDNFLFDQ